MSNNESSPTNNDNVVHQTPVGTEAPSVVRETTAIETAGSSSLAQRQDTTPIPPKKWDRWTAGLVFLSLLLFGLAAFIYFTDPFTRQTLNPVIWVLASGLAFLLLLLAMLRLFILRNNELRMESGCPDCGQQELIRTSRHWPQRLQNAFGIPAYRYRCRNCTWEGTRLSDIGEAISPGVLFARTDQL